MKLTKKEAISYHRQMWSDMQEELGDNPNEIDRIHFKRDWVCKHFPEERIFNDCFLCEYDRLKNGYINNCRNTCLIKWTNGGCSSGDPEFRYYNMPISKLLALPERKVDEVN